jgi:hypothetical protein
VIPTAIRIVNLCFNVNIFWRQAYPTIVPIIFHHSAFDISLFCFAANKHLAAAVLLHRRMASFQFNAQPRIR